MRITFERTGGFGGMRKTSVINTETLPSEEANRLSQLLADVDFFHQPAQIISPKPHPDTFQYKLSVEDGDRKHTVVLGEEALSEHLRQLIDQLTAVARKR